MRERPFDKRTERAVLAGLLLEPGRIADLELELDDFGFEEHQLIYAAMTELADAGDPVDLRTLEALLQRRNVLKQAGGIGYLAELDVDLPDLSGLESYAGILRQLKARRRLTGIGWDLTNIGLGIGDWTELVAAARRELEVLEVPEERPGRSPAASTIVTDVIADARKREEERKRTGRAVLGLQTGLRGLDGLLGGLQAGLILVAGGPGVGKTSLALQIGTHVAEREEAPVVLLTFENAATDLLLQILCSRSGQSARDVRRGFGDVAALEQAAEELAPTLERLVLIDGDGRSTVGQLRGAVRRAMERAGTDRALIVVDYLQLWSKVARELRDLSDARGRVDALAGELMALARQLRCPVLALSSQSRAGGNYGGGKGSSALDSLKESGDLEYSGDVVAVLHPREGSSTSTARSLELTVAKNRRGPIGGVRLVFNPERGAMREEEGAR